MTTSDVCPALDQGSAAALLGDALWRFDACLGTLAAADDVAWAGHAAGAYREALADVRTRAREAARLVELAASSARRFEAAAAEAASAGASGRPVAGAAAW